MAKVLDFNEIKKQYFTVKLADDKGTTLLICTPTKGILDEFLTMKDSLSADAMEDEALTELYSIVAKIMSRNKAGIKITKEKVSALFDFEDVLIFIRAYAEFIGEIANSKN